jgi:hypothetical protein
MLSRHENKEIMAYLTTLYQMQVLFITEREEDCALERVNKKEIVVRFKLHFHTCCSN